MTSSNKNNSNSDYVSTVAYAWNIDMTADVQNRNEIYNRLTQSDHHITQPIDIVSPNGDSSIDDPTGMFDISALDSLINNTTPDNFLSNRIKLNKQ